MGTAHFWIARRRSWCIVAALAAIGTACSTGAMTCVDAVLTSEVRQAVAAESGSLGFDPVLPCGTGRGFIMSSVAIDALPGASSGRRISFIVERNGERAYVLSETRAAITSSQIPQGTRRLSVPAGPVVADGFVGASGSGGEMAYLRWRTGGVTYELDATLGRAVDEADVRQIAGALMLHGATLGR